MAIVSAVFRLQDAEQDSQLASWPFYLEAGKTLADYQAWVTAVAPLVDAVTDSEVMEVNITLPLTLPAGLKANPVALSRNERGGLITYSTNGPRKWSSRIPAIAATIMPGNSFDLADAAIADIVEIHTNAVIPNNVRSKTDHDQEAQAALTGKKSLSKR